MKKIIYIFANIIAITCIILGFLPVLKSPISSIGYSTIFIMSAPGALAFVATISSVIHRFTGAIMFIIMGTIFLYFSYNNLLDKSYYLLAEASILAGLIFFTYSTLINIKSSKNLPQNS